MARFDLIATYMMPNRKNGTLYTGSTSDLWTRIGQHKSGQGSVFTAKYGCDRLVWCEFHQDISAAVHRERRLKTWPRQWKTNLIEEVNPDWKDLTMILPFT
ncbi:GIY-YIG nuclease family protein [Henriciella marina]|uniref:GIY-YIG nuclease family protein n=1 Tax=Henriciella marina TaxID=453851 RepID=A0ABT4LY48_9PROT|nr:GIY-YIG nuclease family protein [Henriciella marina]MCZ4299287.1 GIY-YIG nuclease family protein [Henriciella marina]